MSKPIVKMDIETTDARKSSVHAVVDTGSFYTIIRESCLPKGARIEKFKENEVFGTARRGAELVIVGVIHLKMRVNGHWISGEARVAPDLGSEMLVGAGLMQMWDINVHNKNGHTTLHVGRDMNDPDIQTVL